MGQSPADYNGRLLDEIWKDLPDNAKETILRSLRT
jgi:hypothetical protein